MIGARRRGACGWRSDPARRRPGPLRRRRRTMPEGMQLPASACGEDSIQCSVHGARGHRSGRGGNSRHKYRIRRVSTTDLRPCMDPTGHAGMRRRAQVDPPGSVRTRVHSGPNDPAPAYHPGQMSTTNRQTRLPSDVCDLPIAKIRDGYYSDAYFNYTKHVLEQDGHRPAVLMQVFQRKHAVLGGMDEAVAILRECAGPHAPDGEWLFGWDALDVRALHD